MQNPDIVSPWEIALSAELCKLVDMLGAKYLFLFYGTNNYMNFKAGLQQ